VLSEYFDFNQIEYSKLDLYDPQLDTFGRYTISHPVLKKDVTLLCITYNVLTALLTWQRSKEELEKFVKSGNRVWAWGDCDSAIDLIKIGPLLLSLDSTCPADSVTLFVDANIFDKTLIEQLQNIKIKQIPGSWCQKLFPRISNGHVKKSTCLKDFLLTTVIKQGRPHREILMNQLTARPDLVSRGHVNFNSIEKYKNNWIGQQSPQHLWHDGHASMDLYLDSWLEVVPETLCYSAHYITEKTIKPICTKTPFLVVTTPGFLNGLKSLGFQTFESLIDEKYDTELNLNNRIKLVVDQLEDIIRNGSKSFYVASQHILDHNHRKLAEMIGSTSYTTDICLYHIFKNLNLTVDQKFD
jgi:hypothetical protein